MFCRHLPLLFIPLFPCRITLRVGVSWGSAVPLTCACWPPLQFSHTPCPAPCQPPKWLWQSGSSSPVLWLSATFLHPHKVRNKYQHCAVCFFLYIVTIQIRSSAIIFILCSPFIYTYHIYNVYKFVLLHWACLQCCTYCICLLVSLCPVTGLTKSLQMRMEYLYVS